MYINKNELVRRLVSLTGKDASEFTNQTVEDLSEIYESYVSEGERIYLNVPYKEKGIAKLLGAKYDGEKKKWFIPKGIDTKNFSRWMSCEE